VNARVLVVGSGGREHALCWKLAQSRKVGRVYFAPGNGAADEKGPYYPLPFDGTNFSQLAKRAQELKIDLTVVGPEAPLAAGIVDHFQKAGLLVFGPNAAASRLEASKEFTKEVADRAGVPTAAWGAARTLKEADAAIERGGEPLVVKADGLAAGKGVFICASRAEARQAARRLLQEKALGAAGARLVVEEYLEGVEASFMALVQGEGYALLPTSKDHKRLEDGDRGPNTGGMGAFSPSDDLTSRLTEEAESKVLRPLLREMAARECPYRGVIYCGLMLTAKGPKLLEINVRLGDPESQAILPRLKEDLYPHLNAIAQGNWTAKPLALRPTASLCLVLASSGYPDAPRRGQPIRGLAGPWDDRLLVFHAGTKREGKTVVANGGRVLGLTALGSTLDEARQLAYAAAERIEFEGKIFRQDIGQTKRS
jgi:phosphoribosylamine---glycine ligase